MDFDIETVGSKGNHRATFTIRPVLKNYGRSPATAVSGTTFALENTGGYWTDEHSGLDYRWTANAPILGARHEDVLKFTRPVERSSLQASDIAFEELRVHFRGQWEYTDISGVTRKGEGNYEVVFDRLDNHTKDNFLEAYHPSPEGNNFGIMAWSGIANAEKINKEQILVDMGVRVQTHSVKIKIVSKLK